MVNNEGNVPFSKRAHDVFFPDLPAPSMKEREKLRRRREVAMSLKKKRVLDKSQYSRRKRGRPAQMEEESTPSTSGVRDGTAHVRQQRTPLTNRDRIIQHPPATSSSTNYRAMPSYYPIYADYPDLNSPWIVWFCLFERYLVLRNVLFFVASK